MFSNVGRYEPCGMFTKGHFNLLVITVIAIIIALKYSINKNRKEVHEIIKKLTITICVLEIAKIVYSLLQNDIYDVNKYLPLYYCSMLIYAGLLSSFGKNKLKRAGDVFLATGSIIGGIVFMIMPTTSLLIYPAFHFLSIYSFLFHGTMVYLGLLINKTKYIIIEKKDIKYYASLVGILCLVSLITNNIFNSNLMFISKNFENTPIEIIYEITQGSIVFNAIMIISQITLPFYIMYYAVKSSSYFYRKSYKTNQKGEELTVCQ